MTFFEYLKLALRHKYLIAVITILSITTAMLAAQQINSEKFASTIFVSFATESTSESSDSTVIMTDQFTESVQGWFKNPAFLNEIYTEAGSDLGLSAAKQEKLNLVISYESESTESIPQANNAIQQKLQMALADYNEDSAIDFNIAIFDVHTSDIPDRTGIFVIIGLLLGLALGYAISYLYEEFFGLLKCNDQIENILKAEVYDNYRNQKEFKINNNFLLSKIKNELSNQNLEIFNLTRSHKFGLETISKATVFKKITSINIPEELDKIDPNSPTLLIAELGSTKISTLRKLASLDLSMLTVIIIDHIRI